MLRRGVRLHWLMLFGLSAFGTAAPASGQPWSFTRIADWGTIVPGSSVPFQIFNLPSIRDGVVGFAGYNNSMTGPGGMYTGNGGSLSIVADRTTPIPAGSGNFTNFAILESYWPSMSAGSTAFVGDGSGTSFIQRGIYVREGSALTRVVDRATPMPNGGGAAFFNIWPPSLENGRVAFAGWALGGGQRGVYSWENGSLSVIADKSTPVPNGPGTFTNFFDCALDQGSIVFSAEGTLPHRGLYRADPAGALSRLYDTTTVVPGGNGGNFTGFARSGLSDGAVVFYGQGGGQEGIYTDIGGALSVVANRSTPVPGFPGFTFGGFGYAAIDDGVVAFMGIVGGGPTGVWSTHTGALAKVLAAGDPLDGRIVEDTFIGGQALDGDSIAIQVWFTNGTRGIYMATIPVPGAVAMFAIAGVWAARRRKR